MSFLFVVNPAAGSDDARELLERARRELGEVDVFGLEPGADLEKAVRGAIERDRAVVAVGGDGTVSAVVQHIAGSGGILGVLPAGTLNHFARDVGVRDPDTALEALGGGLVRELDVGKVGDRYFVNTAGLGLYPEIVKERKRREGRLGKWPAAAAAAFRVMRRASPLEGTIAADGDRRALYAWILTVSNNRLSTAPGIGRDRLDEGVLDVLLLLTTRPGARPYMAWRMLRRKPWRVRRTVKRAARRVDVELVGPPRPVARDGETDDPVQRVSFESIPRALRVLVPPP